MLRTQVFGVCIVLMSASLGWADFINGNFNYPIIEAPQWSAGVDSLGTWYGADYSINDNGVEMDYVGHTCNLSGVRGLIQVLPMPEAGTYSWSMDNKLSNYDNQWCYWQVYLLTDDAEVDLVGGPAYGQDFAGAKVISNGYAPGYNDDGEWHHYTDQFTISSYDESCYEYVAYVMAGSLYTSDQVLGYNNFSTSVPTPEPMTVGLLAIGGYAIFRRRAYM